MNILYVNGHPYDGSFHAAIENSYIEGIDEERHAIRRLDLGTLSFDPVLRFGYSKRMPEDEAIARSQELVTWADHIIFAYPMWWGMMPSLMSGWIARVFTPGFGYHAPTQLQIKQLLKGKTADIIITARAPRFSWIYGMNHGQKALTRNLFFYTGIKKRKLLVLDWMHLYRDTDVRRRRFLGRVKRTAATL